MAELKTKKNEASVEDFLERVADEKAREDCRKISVWMKEATGAEPKMWGESIVGFGQKTYQYSTGRDVEWFEVGFSPRKQNITLYLTVAGDWNEKLLAGLGKHKLGKGCLYIKRLSDVDENVLRELIEDSAGKK